MLDDTELLRLMALLPGSGPVRQLADESLARFSDAMQRIRGTRYSPETRQGLARERLEYLCGEIRELIVPFLRD